MLFVAALSVISNHVQTLTIFFVLQIVISNVILKGAPCNGTATTTGAASATGAAKSATTTKAAAAAATGAADSLRWPTLAGAVAVVVAAAAF